MCWAFTFKAPFSLVLLRFTVMTTEANDSNQPTKFTTSLSIFICFGIEIALLFMLSVYFVWMSFSSTSLNVTEAFALFPIQNIHKNSSVMVRMVAKCAPSNMHWLRHNDVVVDNDGDVEGIWAFPLQTYILRKISYPHFNISHSPFTIRFSVLFNNILSNGTNMYKCIWNNAVLNINSSCVSF